MVGVRFNVGQEIPLYFTESKSSLGFTQPPIQWFRWAIVPVVKRPGYDVDFSPPFTAEAKVAEVKPPVSHLSSWGGA
jgi:hypothetical protein